jgi:hypothetical protein
MEEIFKGEDSRLKNYDDLVKIKRGKYGGTWLHNELAFEFAQLVLYECGIAA